MNRSDRGRSSSSRRSFLAAATAGAAGLALAACGSGEAPAGAAAGKGGGGGGGGWTFTDDRGKQISRESRPRRVVAQAAAAAALWDFGVRPIAVFGPHKLKNGSPDPEVGRVDIAEVESIGNVWDEFNVEKYASLRPELLVSGMYVKDTLWYVPEKSKETIEGIAPTVGVKLTGRAAEQTIAKYGELAKALGADIEAAPVVDARQRFERATARLAHVAEAKPGLKVMAVGGSPDLLYVAHARDMPDVEYFIDNGVDMVVPDKPDKAGFYESLSWENADKYDADVILVDARAQSMKLADMDAKPTWRRLPAVRAKQVFPWRAETRYSYLGWAVMLEELVANLEKVERL